MTRKYARKQRKIDKKVTQYLEQREGEIAQGNDPFTAASPYYMNLDFGEILDEQMALNNLRPKVGKQNMAKYCFTAIIVSTIVVLTGAVCLAISVIWTKKGSSLGSMEKSKQFVQKYVENTGEQADNMICDALGYCGKTFQTYLDPEVDNEQFKREFQQLQAALLRVDFVNPII